MPLWQAKYGVWKVSSITKFMALQTLHTDFHTTHEGCPWGPLRRMQFSNAYQLCRVYSAHQAIVPLTLVSAAVTDNQSSRRGQQPSCQLPQTQQTVLPSCHRSHGYRVRCSFLVFNETSRKKALQAVAHTSCITVPSPFYEPLTIREKCA